MPDQVVIRIPASTAHIGLVRATGSALAALCDFTYDRITDLHIAIDEVCSRILASSDQTVSRLEVTFTLEERAIQVSARADGRLKEGAPFLTDWSKAILDAVTDDMQIKDDDGQAQVSFKVARG